MSIASYWWFAAGLLVVAELLTGTFYLLMLALGMVVAALLAHLGVELAWQWAGAGLSGGFCVLLWRQYHLKASHHQDSAQEPQRSLDVGETVQVHAWRDDGTCSVFYRGAQWEALLSNGESPQSGTFVITQVQGSRLVLAHRPNP